MEDVVGQFREKVWSYYREHGRDDLPWRQTMDPYAVLVSEVMLQQTQVTRVVPKFAEFLEAFPTLAALAAAPLDDVLWLWRGLGYNRRALSLKRSAEVIMAEHGGAVPRTLEELTALPGVGHATAAQVLAFAYNVGVPFIETNIRSVFLHEFFPDAQGVPDAALLPFVAATLDTENPREWYWALLDYGTYLKTATANPSRRSGHHVRQGPFEGSNRQLRGRLLAALLDAGREGLSDEELIERVEFEGKRVAAAVQALQSEGFVSLSDGRWRIG